MFKWLRRHKVTDTPTFRLPTEDEKVLVKVRVFKCCTDNDGTYLGSAFIHDPKIPGDGPWYTVVEKKDVSVTFGFGTKAAALTTANALTRYVIERVEMDVAPWDDDDA